MAVLPQTNEHMSLQLHYVSGPEPSSAREIRQRRASWPPFPHVLFLGSKLLQMEPRAVKGSP